MKLKDFKVDANMTVSAIPSFGQHLWGETAATTRAKFGIEIYSLMP